VIYTATRHNLHISLPLPPGEGRGEGEIQKLRLCRVAVCFWLPVTGYRQCRSGTDAGSSFRSETGAIVGADPAGGCAAGVDTFRFAQLPVKKALPSHVLDVARREGREVPAHQGRQIRSGPETEIAPWMVRGHAARRHDVGYPDLGRRRTGLVDQHQPHQVGKLVGAWFRNCRSRSSRRSR